MKIVINKSHGAFGLSYEAVMEYAKLKGIQLYAYSPMHTRMNISLNKVVEYDGKSNEFIILYSTEKLNKNSTLKKRGYFDPCRIRRDDPDLIKVVEKLGDTANSKYSKLKIVEIPDGINWEVEEYDGIEWIAESHRTWD